MDYRSAGVDVAAGRAFVERIRASVDTTRRPEVIGSLGGFGGLCRLPGGLRRPLLVAPSWSWPRPMAATRRWASTWWPCASTTC